jgi:nicotinate-nucleotide adenylyltransferase
MTGPAPVRPRPLGVFGGTFDPIHFGHLELAREVREALRLEQVLLLPAGDPPHRAAPVASALHRLAMAELAAAQYPGITIDSREIARKGRSYTVLTLQELRSERPFQPLALIVGTDAFLGFSTWHRWREIFDLAHVILVARPGADLTPGLHGALAAQWRRRRTTDPRALEMPEGGSIYQQVITPHAISASAIRAALARGNTGQVRGLLPAAVLAYIGRNHLYRPSSPDAS